MKLIGKVLLLIFSLIAFGVDVIGIGMIGIEFYQKGEFIGFVISLVIGIFVFVSIYKILAKPRVRSGWLPWD